MPGAAGLTAAGSPASPAARAVRRTPLALRALSCGYSRHSTWPLSLIDQMHLGEIPARIAHLARVRCR